MFLLVIAIGLTVVGYRQYHGQGAQPEGRTWMNVPRQEVKKCHGLAINGQCIKVFCYGLNPGVMLPNFIPQYPFASHVNILFFITSNILREIPMG